MIAEIGGATAASLDVLTQGAQMALHLQDHFSWGSVAEAGLMPFAHQYLDGPIGTFAGNFGKAAGAVSAIAEAIMAEGVGVAVGAQSKFDWGGVAGNLVGSTVGGWVDGALTSMNASPGVVTSGFMAADLAVNAATRGLFNGKDFGDNIVAALPVAIGDTVGEMETNAAKTAAQTNDPSN